MGYAGFGSAHDSDNDDHGHRHVTTCNVCGGCGEDCPRCGSTGHTTHDEDDCPGVGECDEAVEAAPVDEVAALRELAAHHLRRDGFRFTAAVLELHAEPLDITRHLLSLMGREGHSAGTEETLDALFWSACAEIPMGPRVALPCESLWTPADAVVGCA